MTPSSTARSGDISGVSGLASVSDLVANAMTFTTQLEQSIAPESRAYLAVRTIAALKDYYESLSSLPDIRPHARDLKKRRAQLMREERRRQLLYPTSDGDFVRTLWWMVENGEKVDLDLLAQVMIDPPYASETIRQLSQLAEQEISARVQLETVTLHTWGPACVTNTSWPPDFARVAVEEESWPVDAPVLVHLDDAAAFAVAAQAHLQSDGRLPDAVLYIPAGRQAPAELWTYFDVAVAENNWQALRSLLACPRRMRSIEAVEDLPASFLASLEQLPEELDPATLPLPAAATEHLRDCSICRQALVTALAERLQLRRHLACPTAAALDALARGHPQPGVAKHVATCGSCQARASVLESSR